MGCKTINFEVDEMGKKTITKNELLENGCPKCKSEVSININRFHRVICLNPDCNFNII